MPNLSHFIFHNNSPMPGVGFHRCKFEPSPISWTGAAFLDWYGISHTVLGHPPPFHHFLDKYSLFFNTCMYMQVYGPNNKADIQNQQDLQAAFDDIFFQYQVDMTW